MAKISEKTANNEGKNRLKFLEKIAKKIAERCVKNNQKREKMARNEGKKG